MSVLPRYDVLTQTEAYLYVKYNNKITEYKVVNRGDVFNPVMHKVQFKDTQTNIIRRHIPFYEETGTLYFVYSNIQLTDAQFEEFTPTELTVEDKNNACVIHPKEYSKEVKAEIKAFRKKEQKAGVVRAESKTRKYVSTLLYLDDPVGEVEDLYNDYEFTYHKAYGMNKSIIEDIRAKNQYSYAVADLLDYLYVDKKEQSFYDTQREELLTQYEVLAEEVLKQGLYIDKNIIGLNLGSFIEYETAKDYMDEVKFIDKAFFTKASKRGLFSEDYFKIDIGTRRCKYSTSNQTKYQSNYSAQYFSELFLQGKNYLPRGKESASDALAYVVLSFCYSPKNKEQLESLPKLKAASETFYYLLKNAQALPQIDEKTKDEISDEMEDQHEFTNITKGQDKLLSEFENLENSLKEIAFNSKKALERKAKNNYGLKSLYSGKSTQEIYHNEKLKVPEDILKEIVKALKDEDLKTLLNSYKSIETFENDEDEHEYYNSMMNLSYMLIAPRAKFDSETQEVSLFNDDNKAIQELILHFTEKLNNIGEEKAKKLHDEPIKQHYLDALFSLITHANLEKPLFEVDSSRSTMAVIINTRVSDKGRKTNVQSFLNAIKVEVAQQELDTSNINDQNYDDALKLKTDSATLYEKLKKLDGVSSYIDKFDGSVDDILSESGQKLDIFKDFRKSTKYKALLASSKALSFFMVAGNIASFVQGKKSINVKNLIELSGDIISVSRTVVNISKDPVAKHAVPGAKGLSKVKVPESLEHVAKLDKVVSASTMKVIARFGLIGPIAGAVNELSEINAKENEDYFIAVVAKNAIYVGLLFSPALVAFGAVVLTELVWYFIKDYIENSKIELYLYDSLLFNTKEHNDKHFFNEIETDKACRASIFLETLKSSNKPFKLKQEEIKASELQGFSSFKETREFIADNYKAHSNIIDVAMLNELAQLKSVLYGYTLKTEEVHNNIIRLQAAGMSINLHVPDLLKPSASLYREIDDIYLSYTKLQPNDVKEQYYEKIEKATKYDIAGDIAKKSKVFEIQAKAIGLYEKTDREKAIWMQSASQSTIMRQMLENVAIIFKSENVTIKYEIKYNVYFQSANNYAQIEELKLSSLTEQDHKKIKELDA